MLIRGPQPATMLRMPASALLVADDILKLFLLVATGGGLLLLGRWSSRLGGTRSGDFTTDAPTPDVKDFLPGGKLSVNVWPPSAEEVAASLPYDPSLGKLRILRLFFKKSDVSPGPDDPEVFADELHIELYDPDSNHAWWQSFFVATPQGLAKILREKSWRYLHAPNMLVFPRYDFEEIRRAVVNRIVAENEYFKGERREQEESL